MVNWDVLRRPLWHWMVIGGVLRVLAILYGAWHDSHFVVKYTDIDYIVFTDAARFVSEGKSPYCRATYRYTPLLAQLLLPNIWVSPLFGKLIFSAADLAAGWMIHSLLLLRGASSSIATTAAAVHILNPLVLNTSTRGNADAIPALLVLLVLRSLVNRRHRLAAVIYGTAVHARIYPAVFAIALAGPSISPQHFSNTFRRSGRKLASSDRKRVVGGPKDTFAVFWRYVTARERVEFAVISASVFFILLGVNYAAYGWEFLEETYLYHVVRHDPRHNFSVYFYEMYLRAGNTLSTYAAFLPQAVLIIITSFVYGRDPFFACFLLTHVFVTFNKVCTVQYFVWYLSLLPLSAPRMDMSWRRAASLLGVFLGTQGIWLRFAYLLEFLGENTFFLVWLAGIIFFIGNVWIVCEIVRSYDSVPLFANGEVVQWKDKKKVM